MRDSKYSIQQRRSFLQDDSFRHYEIRYWAYYPSFLFCTFDLHAEFPSTIKPVLYDRSTVLQWVVLRFAPRNNHDHLLVFLGLFRNRWGFVILMGIVSPNLLIHSSTSINWYSHNDCYIRLWTLWVFCSWWCFGRKDFNLFVGYVKKGTKYGNLKCMNFALVLVSSGCL